jgi:phosphate transport system substrate-binding protein
MLYFKYLKKLTLLIFIIVLMSDCRNSNKSYSSATGNEKLNGSISISGAFALYPIAQRWADEFMKLNPEIKIDISAGGAGKGMADVLNNMTDLAMFSKEITGIELKNGAYGIAVVKDAVFGIVSSENPYLKEIKEKGMTKKQLIDIYISKKINSWNKLFNTKGNEKINIFTRSDACGAAEMWAKYLGKKQEDLTGIGVYGDPGISEAVKKDKFSIGFNNLAFIFDQNNNKKNDGIEIIPLDLNENGKIDKEENFYSSINELTDAIAKNQYPSPPARELYFVSKGKPVNAIAKAFLKWVLTDGQKYVSNSGYVNLPANIIENELVKLK